MNAQRNKGFTLIEMLIVVAIMAILAAGTISFITIPPREQVQATTDLEIEQGLGGFFTHLVADAHNATTLTLARDGRGLSFDNARADARSVYFVDGKDCLRHALRSNGDIDVTSGPAGLLARGVRRLAATPLKENGMWRIEIALATGDDLRSSITRAMEVSVGHFRRK